MKDIKNKVKTLIDKYSKEEINTQDRIDELTNAYDVWGDVELKDEINTLQIIDVQQISFLTALEGLLK